MDTSNFIVNLIRKSVHQLVKRSQDETGPIKDDDTTNSLCSAIEAVLLNGQEEVGYKKMLTKFRFSSTRQPYECCYWDYLQHYLPKQLSNMILHSRIQEKRTPIGCCRAWVRIALNESTICNFLESMLCDTERTNRFYKPSALLRDGDRMEAAMGLLRVLVTQCDFELDYVGWELNSWNRSTALSLANVHYVVPTITPLRAHSRSNAGPFRVDDSNRPTSRSNPEPTDEHTEVSQQPIEVKPNTEPAEEPVDSSPSVSSVEMPDDMGDDRSCSPLITESLEASTTVPDESTNESSIETPRPQSSSMAIPMSTEKLDETDSKGQMSVDGDYGSRTKSSYSSATPPMPTSDASSTKAPPLTSMQVADELPASPQVNSVPILSVASMTSSEIIAEAVRLGLLVTMPVELSDSYMQTLIRAIEERRRVEREEALEAIYEKRRSGFLNSPMLSGDDTSLASSWDRQGFGVGSSTSELALPSDSPPVILNHHDDDDDFAVFPRRRSRLESGGELVTSCSVPNLSANNSSAQKGKMNNFRPAYLLDSSSLSNSWDRSGRGPVNNNSHGRDNVESPTPLIETAEVTTPQSEGILDRIYSNFPKGRRGSASSLILRLGSGIFQSASRLRGSSTASNTSKQESDEEWEIVGDEFIATKNARCARLLDVHPGAERIPDPNHDFADTNCARCRGHIIGRSRRLDNFDGRWYCSRCHEGALSYIPRRIIFNWDFTPQVVSNETKVILTRLFLQPNIDVMKTNPALYTICPELREVTRVRRQLAFLWQYVCDCPSGVARDMSRMLIPRERLIATIPEIHLYSLEDLTLIHHGGALLKLIHHVLKLGLTHVWSCTECQMSRPHFCDRCGERVPLYELDIYHKCITATCDAVIHKRCFTHVPEDFMCLICTRKKENNVPLHETYDAVFVE